MQDDNIIAFSEVNQSFVKVSGRNGGCRVVRIGYDHKLCTGGNVSRNFIKLNDVIVLAELRHKENLRAGNLRAVSKDRIARVRN